ncbi:hypothetical protein [Aliivibrio fischeri]|uniref:hypothetical protein n=1 Tax=Aliivibrio fischeri TaxID=668 RepID=UPI0012DA1EF4|nr:hypothetical protein [Aliivibrio fischeri]MUL16273.1 hypothetical protein [Aliivibrio fischeri]
MQHLTKNEKNNKYISLTSEQLKFIENINLPKKLLIPSDSKFDSVYIDIALDKWVFTYIGKVHSLLFNLENNSANKLLKFVVIQITNSASSPVVEERFYALKWLFKNINFSSDCHFKKLEDIATNTKKDSLIYFDLKKLTKLLFRINFPLFDIDDYEQLNFIKIPAQANNFLKYEDIENTMPSHLKNLIAKRLVEYSTEEGLKNIKKSDLKNLVVLGISFCIGLRSAQFSKLYGSLIKLDTTNRKTGLKRYSIQIPLAKKQHVSGEKPKIALSYEIGQLIDAYKKTFNLSEEEQLFKPLTNNLSVELHEALHNALFFIQPNSTKKLILSGEMFQPIYTLYDFRHNIGHSMAMRGASEDEIAHVLGHSSTIAARHYIMATPELAMLKHQALGKNPVWSEMIGLMMTGNAANIDTWNGKIVSGMLGGKLFLKIGGCNRYQDKCHLSKVRSCYGCFYFRPFKDIEKHKSVHKIITLELIDLVEVSNKSGNYNNPLIEAATDTKHEVEIVINRLLRAVQ